MKPERPDKQGEKGKGKPTLRKGDPFEPKSVYDVLTVMKTSDDTFQRGKQEDAEEFLTCLLNKLHEEAAEAIKLNAQQSNPTGTTECRPASAASHRSLQCALVYTRTMETHS